MAGTEPQTDQDYNQPARIIRRVHHGEDRRTPYETDHSNSHVQRRIHQSGYLPHFSFIFNGTTHIHLPPTVGFGPAGSSGVGNNQLTPNATLGFGGQTSQAQFLPEYDSQAAAPPAVDLGLNDGGFTSGAQMNAIWSEAVAGGYNPWEPGANLTPSVPTPAGLGPAGSSGVGYNQLSPIVRLDFDGQTPQGPFVTEYDTQAAAPPPTLDHLFLPPSWATAANNDFAEDCLPSSASDSFMDQIFRD
ncbi:hypothetical protein Q3G72_016804 [Acer saccharum]|nr:hypothetical protein Q3G72_016804 [Acer saccharum]